MDQGGKARRKFLEDPDRHAVAVARARLFSVDDAAAGEIRGVGGVGSESIHEPDATDLTVIFNPRGRLDPFFRPTLAAMQLWYAGPSLRDAPSRGSEVEEIDEARDIVIAQRQARAVGRLPLPLERIEQPMQAPLVQAEPALHRIGDQPGEAGEDCGPGHEPTGDAGGQRPGR